MFRPSGEPSVRLQNHLLHLCVWCKLDIPPSKLIYGLPTPCRDSSGWILQGNFCSLECVRAYIRAWYHTNWAKGSEYFGNLTRFQRTVCIPSSDAPPNWRHFPWFDTVHTSMHPREQVHLLGTTPSYEKRALLMCPSLLWYKEWDPRVKIYRQDLPSGVKSLTQDPTRDFELKHPCVQIVRDTLEKTKMDTLMNRMRSGRKGGKKNLAVRPAWF